MQNGTWSAEEWWMFDNDKIMLRYVESCCLVEFFEATSFGDGLKRSRFSSSTV